MFYIKTAMYTGHVLTLQADAKNGTKPTMQAKMEGSSTQLWKFVPSSESAYLLIQNYSVEAGGRFIDIDGGKETIVWHRCDNNNQKFYICT